MVENSYQITEGKVIIRIKDRICDTSDELLSNKLFLQILTTCVRTLKKRNSKLIRIFDHPDISEDDIFLLVKALNYLTHLSYELVPKVVAGSDQFFRDRDLFSDFVEYVYNYWRHLQRLIICDSINDHLDQRPYRTFNRTVESLTHLIRGTYRDIQENITCTHPRIYRQVHAGAEVAAIALPLKVEYPPQYAQKLNEISIIRQVLINPPMIFTSGSNTRSGMFQPVEINPILALDLNNQDWLCYPAKVGPLLVMVYFSLMTFDLNFALSNLFELADDQDLQRKPDAVLIFGVPEGNLPNTAQSKTVFYDDQENDLLVGTIPAGKAFGYFGYLKKMALTLHNIKMMKLGRLPYHGAMFQLTLQNAVAANVLVMGDTGAGKSETLEALRTLGEDALEDLVIVADDMGSLTVNEKGEIIGYGTETGAFVRLDDLQPGYAYGQIDRAIIMNPNQKNARVVIPITTYNEVIKGYPLDVVLYANNYEPVDNQHPVLEAFKSPEAALSVFRAGAVMSKGTTSTTGLVNTYFANVFGPAQFPELYDALAAKYFQKFFDCGIFVGQMRTQLGIPGQERSGPERAARELLALLRTLKPK
jgi:hypothetical protein